MKSEIYEVEESLRQAMLTSDVGLLEQLLDPRLLFVGPDGTLVRKEDDLALHRSKAQQLSRLDLDDPQIELHGATACVTVRAHVAGSLRGHPFEATCRYIRTWIKTGNAWRVVGGSVTFVAPSA